MDRVVAYRILTEALMDWQSRPFDEIHAQVGQPIESRVECAGVDYLVFVSVFPLKDEPASLRLEVGVGSTSTWRTERLEDAVIVRHPDGC